MLESIAVYTRTRIKKRAELSHKKALDNTLTFQLETWTIFVRLGAR